MIFQLCSVCNNRSGPFRTPPHSRGLRLRSKPPESPRRSVLHEARPRELSSRIGTGQWNGPRSNTNRRVGEVGQWPRVINAYACPVPDTHPNFELPTRNVREHVDTTRIERHGQCTFRLGSLTALARQCAVIREQAVPVLDAAHVQRCLGPAPQSSLAATRAGTIIAMAPDLGLYDHRVQGATSDTGLPTTE